ncbi:MAG: hypothetical protein WC192_01745 [Candidatus Babeliales bacterium]|jgi:VIT1/CCC1 family predicted Fe2+/Mn2+ transporter
MRYSFKSGLGFGITSGVITTLGLLVGLNAGTQSKLAVIGGILTIAIADALSDSLGMHISKEFESRTSITENWEATLVTFFSKFFVALSFIVPALYMDLSSAIKVGVLWGLFLLCSFSYVIAKDRKANPLYVMGEHVFIASVVILTVQFVGSFIRSILI